MIGNKNETNLSPDAPPAALGRAQIDEKKELNAQRLALAVLKMVSECSTENDISLSDIARASGISRGWIYKYVGSSTRDLIAQSCELVYRQFCLLDIPQRATDKESWVALHLADCELAFNDIERAPWLSDLYFRNRTSQTSVGLTIQRLESEFLSKSSFEAHQILGISLEQATDIAAAVAAFKIGLLHRWSTNSAKTPDAKSSLLGQLKIYLVSTTNTPKPTSLA